LRIKMDIPYSIIHSFTIISLDKRKRLTALNSKPFRDKYLFIEHT
jgi:hypothetical protein